MTEIGNSARGSVGASADTPTSSLVTRLSTFVKIVGQMSKIVIPSSLIGLRFIDLPAPTAICAPALIDGLRRLEAIPRHPGTSGIAMISPEQHDRLAGIRLLDCIH